MAKDKTPTIDPLTSGLLSAFNETMSCMLVSAMYNGGPEAAYVVANTAIESLTKQRDSIKEAWIEQKETEKNQEDSGKS